MELINTHSFFSKYVNSQNDKKFLIFINNFHDVFNSYIAFVDNFIDFVNEIKSNINFDGDLDDVSIRITYSYNEKYVDIMLGDHETDHGGLVGTSFTIYGLTDEHVDEIVKMISQDNDIKKIPLFYPIRKVD